MYKIIGTHFQLSFHFYWHSMLRKRKSYFWTVFGIEIFFCLGIPEWESEALIIFFCLKPFLIWNLKNSVWFLTMSGIVLKIHIIRWIHYDTSTRTQVPYILFLSISSSMCDTIRWKPSFEIFNFSDFFATELRFELYCSNSSLAATYTHCLFWGLVSWCDCWIIFLNFHIYVLKFYIIVLDSKLLYVILFYPWKI